MKTLRNLMLSLTLILAVLLTGCGGGAKPAAPKPEAPKPAAQKLKIALVLPSTIDDMAWA